MSAQVVLLVPLGELGGGVQIPGMPLPGHPGYPSGQPVPPGQHPHPGHDLPPGHEHPSAPIALPPDQPWPPPASGKPPIVPPNPPPNTIWPPLTPGTATKKALVLVYISGYGERHIVVELPEPK